mmetsp:Transcript_11085/g.12141  ORF Transcript_11085/g.12141 Transcript_11085/m.12141 type:complete len:160 (-) Transcript_11085:11-490(-)
MKLQNSSPWTYSAPASWVATLDLNHCSPVILMVIEKQHQPENLETVVSTWKVCLAQRTLLRGVKPEPSPLRQRHPEHYPRPPLLLRSSESNPAYQAYTAKAYCGFFGYEIFLGEISIILSGVVLVVEIQTHPTRGSREDGERLWSQIGNATEEILKVPV